MSKLGIIVNPFSGRDVRRVVARASVSDHHEKRQQVTRLVLGAFSQGVQRIYLARDPFRINAGAVENLPEKAKVTILKFPLRHTAEDTLTMARMMWDEGCRVFVALGGDGTSRIVSGALPDATLLPLSTGTNNAFPQRIEASVAGVAAGVVASGKVDPRAACRRCKRVHIEAGATHDVALVDAVLLRNDYLGSLLPFAAKDIAAVVLARADPASTGASPIGGCLLPSGHEDDFGVLVACGESAGRAINVPLSPGLHADIGIKAITKLALGDTTELRGPGILAFDGDRTIKLAEGEAATLRVLRDGPRIIEAEKIMRLAAEGGKFEPA